MKSCYLGTTGQNEFDEKVKEILSTEKHKLVFMALDISNFKYINDYYGWDEGDRVMNDIAEFYFVNEPLCVVAHGIGFDQFRCAYDIGNFTREEFADYILRKNAAFEHFLTEKYPLVYHHVYIGLYYYTDPELPIRIATDRANLAKKSTKGKYNAVCQVFNDENCNAYLENMSISNEFIHACEEDRIEVYLQPKFSVSRNLPVGAEALVRMRDASGNLVPPIKFVPLLETTGLVGRLDEIMIEKVFALQRKLIDEGKNILPISVNVSRQKFTSDGFLTFVISMQQKYDIDAELVEFEILETTLIDAMGSMVDVIKMLRDNGFKIDVDDFGSGYSSLNQIANIPADVIKFDRGFVTNSLKTDKGRKVIKSLIELMNGIDYECVFEGIETQDELDLITGYGCDFVQGYYFDKPLPAEDFIEKYL